MDQREQLYELEHEMEWRYYQRLRFAKIALLTLIPIVIASVVLPLFIEFGQTQKIILTAVSMGAMGAVGFVYLQLQRSRRSYSSAGEGEQAWRYQRLEDKIEELQRQVRGSSTGKRLEEAERADLVRQLKASIQTEAAAEVLEEVQASIREQSGEAELAERFTFTARRLKDEIQALTGRANINLIIGIVTTLAGIGVLWYTVYTSDIDYSSVSNVVGHYLPRLSVVVLIEVFAYFFLRLYKGGLAEIKYYQNELTNFESRFLALLLAFRRNDSEILGKVILELAATERNFVLSLGQTTVELEKERQRGEHIGELADSLSVFLQRGTK